MTDRRSTDPEAFIRSLFGPLPKGEEVAETKAFRRLAEEDAKLAWQPLWLKAEAARHFVAATRRQGDYARFYGWYASGTLMPIEKMAIKSFTEELDEVMQWPAPNAAALRWKLKHRNHDGGRDAWEAAIAADEARLGPRRKKAGEPA